MTRTKTTNPYLQFLSMVYRLRAAEKAYELEPKESTRRAIVARGKVVDEWLKKGGWTFAADAVQGTLFEISPEDGSDLAESG